jgi:hypothetical protein
VSCSLPRRHPQQQQQRQHPLSRIQHIGPPLSTPRRHLRRSQQQLAAAAAVEPRCAAIATFVWDLRSQAGECILPFVLWCCSSLLSLPRQVCCKHLELVVVWFQWFWAGVCSSLLCLVNTDTKCLSWLHLPCQLPSSCHHVFSGCCISAQRCYSN